MKNFEDHYHKYKYSMYSQYKFIYVTSSSGSNVFFVLKKKLFACKQKKKKKPQTPKPDFH